MKRGGWSRRDFLTVGAAGGLGWAAVGAASEPPEGMSLVEIDGVADIEDIHSVLILKDAAKDRYLQVWVSFYQANLIRISLSGAETPRPMTYELMRDLLDAAGASIRHTAITRIERMTYFAQVAVAAGGETRLLDCRPSDGVALAVQAGAPVYVSNEVLEREGRTEKQIKERMNRISPLNLA